MFRLIISQSKRRCSRSKNSFGAAGPPARGGQCGQDREGATGPKLREVIRSCDLINVDGQPVVWMSRWLGQPLKERVNGTDLMMALIERSAEKGYRPFFLGAKEEVVAKVAQTLQARYPQLRLAGWHDGYWSTEEEPAVVEQIRRSEADILFVAISSPKKEIFLGKWKEELGVPFMMGVGGSFDVAAGCVKRAPRWMQKAGLEWLYRLMQEPARMWRRYLVNDMAIVPLFWKEWWRLRSRRRRCVCLRAKTDGNDKGCCGFDTSYNVQENPIPRAGHCRRGIGVATVRRRDTRRTVGRGFRFHAKQAKRVVHSVQSGQRRAADRRCVLAVARVS